MISLLKTANELERLEELHRAATECCALAVAAAAQYPVELDPAETTQLRAHLKTLEGLLRDSGSADDFKKVTASFRGELREYRDRAHQRLNRMRQELQAAAEAMKSFAEGVATQGADHERELASELQHLDQVSRLEDLAQVRRGIHSAAKAISLSVDQMRRGNQLLIVQLQDEIRLLHQEMQAERRAIEKDRASGAWNRQKIEGRIEELLGQDDSFCVLLIALRNFRGLESRHSRTVVEGALKAMLMRLDQMLGEDVMIGRWSESEFAAILPIEPAQVVALSKEVTGKLSGAYSVQENGMAHTVSIQAATGVADRRTGVAAESFLKKLEQMSQAVERA